MVEYIFLRCSKERLPHGNASDPLFSDRSEDLELHPCGRDLSCSTTVFEPGDQEARGGIGGRAVPQRALQYPPHRPWPQGGTTAYALLRKRGCSPRPCWSNQERCSGTAPAGALPQHQLGAVRPTPHRTRARLPWTGAE